MAALIINAHNIGVVLHGTHDELFAWRMMTYNIFVVPEAMICDGRFPKVTKPITNQLWNVLMPDRMPGETARSPAVQESRLLKRDVGSDSWRLLVVTSTR